MSSPRLLRFVGLFGAFLLCSASAAACASATAEEEETASDDIRHEPDNPAYHFDLPLDREAGEELIDGEEASIVDSATIVKSLLEKKYGSPGSPRPVNRANHAVSHGCVSASFEVLPVAKHLRQGMFAEPKTYRAWMRFSNTDGVMSGRKSERDDESVPRGVGIKVLGVEGEQLLPSRTDVHTQDFLVTNRPVFYFKDIVVFSQGLRVIQKGPLEMGKFIVQHPLAASDLICRVATDRLDKNRIDDPLNTPYWSKLPHKFGSAEPIKYSIWPCEQRPVVLPEDPPARYLRGAMKRRLDATLEPEGACFEFKVQRRTDPRRMPIEDGSIEWDEDVSVPELVARITIPPQDFDTLERDAFCENLTFSPWNSVSELRPLGNLNRARKIVEALSAEYRHDKNNVPMTEPE